MPVLDLTVAPPVSPVRTGLLYSWRPQPNLPHMTLKHPTRRSVLQSIAAAAVSLRPLTAAQTQQRPAGPIELPATHKAAVNRRRRIVVQYDAFNNLGVDFRDWIDFRFSYADEAGSQIDSLWWDIGGNPGTAVYPSKILPEHRDPKLMKWRGQGIDWAGELINETRKRKLEVFWNHRISEVEVAPEGGLEMKRMNPWKKDHPDWTLKTWWWQGMWNLAAPGLREFKLSVLRELAENYDLDGFQLDFARHMPVLEPGRQWELRDNVTTFVRMVRSMLLDVARKKGRPILLAARVPRNLKGCRVDGFDIEEWARQNLVDILTLGSRSVEVDISGYRKAVGDRNIKLQPCFDDHHTTDGYRNPPIEVFRGAFANWWQQGADSVITFNWSNAPPEHCKRIGAHPGPLSQRQAYQEAGSPKTLASKDKVFFVERRGGYPWSTGYFNHNRDALLPVQLPNIGRPIKLDIGISDAVKKGRSTAQLRIILFQTPSRWDDHIKPGDAFEAALNGKPLKLNLRDPDWKDAQIFSPKPQRTSGGTGIFEVDPNQKLLKLEFEIEPGVCRVGKNQIEIRIAKREPYRPQSEILLEKLEVHLKYT